MSTTAPASLAIVIASCDKYSDLWDPLFGEFFTNWADCPFPIYLVANHKQYNDPRVITLLAGDDLDWSTTISRALKDLDHSHILFWIDDAFLVAQPSTQRISRLLVWMMEAKANFLRLRPTPLPEKWLNQEIGVLKPGAAYRVSLFATIWRKEVLDSILKPGESAWQFEIEGTKRSNTIGGFFSVRAEVFQYLHGVERGTWIRSAAMALQRKGYVLAEGRPIMGKMAALHQRYRILKTQILHLFPERHRQGVLTVANTFYRLIGARK